MNHPFPGATHVNDGTGGRPLMNVFPAATRARIAFPVAARTLADGVCGLCACPKEQPFVRGGVAYTFGPAGFLPDTV